MHTGPTGETPGAIKQQIIGLIHAIAYLRGMSEAVHSASFACTSFWLECATKIRNWTRSVLAAVPLIAVNTLVILVKIIFG